MKRTLAAALSLIFLLGTVLPAAFAAVVRGDVNFDGAVLSDDARLVLRISVGLEPYGPGTQEYEAADYDGDGVVRASDARATLRCAVGLTPIDDPDEPAPQLKTDELNVCLASEPDNLDPALTSSVDGFSLLVHLFSGLAKWTRDENGKYAIEPDAAVALPAGATNADGTVTYTYTLRDDAVWSDGQPVTARDFVFAWNRAASPELWADYGYMFEVVDGYDALQEWGGAVARLNVNAPDDKTLSVTLTSDVPYWNELLAFPTFFPVREDAVKNEAWAADPAAYVCNGPYTLERWAHNDVITLQKNNNYYDADAITMQKLNFHLSGNADLMFARFRSGDWQFIDDVPGIDALKEAYPEELKIVGQIGTYYLCWNVNVDLLPADSGLTGAAAEAAREEIRNAVNRLFDRSFIANEIVQGGQVPASSFVAMGLTDADDKTEFYRNAGGSDGYIGYYDVSEAALQRSYASALETLKKYYRFDEAAGRFTNFPSLTYLYNTSPAHMAIGEYLRSALQNVGIDLTLEDLDWNAFLNVRKEGGYTIARNGWLADFNDPISFLDMWTTASGNNDVQFGRGDNASLRCYDLDLTPFGYGINVHNGTWAETYDVLISVIRTCKDKEIRYRLMHLAEDLLMKTGCICPLYYYTDAYMIDSAVQGFFSNPLGTKYFMYTGIAE